MRKLNYLMRTFFQKTGRITGNKKLKRISKFVGIGVGFGSSAFAISKADVNTSDGNIVANVYGGVRFLRSIKIGLWISADYYFSMVGLNESSPNYKAMMSRIHQRAADDILNGCLVNGGSYIKLGQGLVSLSHIIPKEYCETLKALHDKCLARKQNELYEIFEQDFGKSPDDIFKSFDKEPIAAASIAQVFKAQTKDDRTVAVKVQYIDLQKRFQTDVTTVNMLLKIVTWMHPKFNFTWVLQDLEQALRQELDFINEGLNSERCAKDLKDLKYIHIPEVLWDLTSTRVLVAEFIDGYKVNEVEELKKHCFSLSDINNKLFEAFGVQIFQTGFVHADPHPGNVIIRRVNGKTQLVLLDHGLYQRITDKERIALSHFWKAMVLKDHANMKKYSNILGVKDYELFAEILTQSPLKAHGFKLRSKLTEEDLQHMTEFARDRFDNIIGCLQEMPRTLLLVIRNLNTIRAIAHDHGNPIDRYAILARTATKTAFDEKSLTRSIFNIPTKIYFEILLHVNRVVMWFRAVCMNILSHYGMIPDINVIMTKANMSF